jgi:uncharacterized SAM-dependent methyltransferase
MPGAHAPDAVPGHLLGDSAWRAVLHILTANLFARDRRVWAHVDLEGLWIDFEAILAEGTWSAGERRLLSAAASLFGAEHPTGLVDLTELVGGVDESGWRLLLGALALRRAGMVGSAWPLDLAGLLEG